jgi:predicted secreted hydrolase
MKKRIVVLLALVTCIVMASSAQARLPLGIELPRRVTPHDLLATGGEDGDIANPVPGGHVCDSAPRREIVLPRDDAPHNGYWGEWWWWYGHLEATDGKRFGFVTLMSAHPWQGVHALEYAITDLTDGSFHPHQEPALPGRPEATAAPGGFQANGRHGAVSGANGNTSIAFDVDGYRLDLDLTTTKPAVLELVDGYANAYCNNAYLYARPRMRATGTLSRSGETVDVTGTANLEHFWGFTPVAEALAWDWYTMRLDDGRDINLSIVEVAKGFDGVSVRFGWISNADGTTSSLHRGDFEVTPTRFWQRDATCSYPVAYDVRVRGERFQISAALDQTEIRSIHAPLRYLTWPNFATYWDGPTVVSGDAAGRGWTDLGHYCA